MNVPRRLFLLPPAQHSSQALWPAALAILLLTAQIHHLPANPPADSPPGLATAAEWTTVTATLSGLPENARPGGVVFFLLQRRLLEIPPGPMALDAIASRCEASAAVSTTGIIEARLPPGNFLMVWDPNAQADDQGRITSPRASSPSQPIANLGQPGPESLQSAPTDEAGKARVSRQRREAIAHAGQSEQPTVVQGNRLNTGNQGTDRLPVFVAFNRFLRPPAVDLGTWSASEANTSLIRITLLDADGSPTTRGTLRIRGHNGDMLEPLPLSRVASGDGSRRAEPGVHLFRDVLPQPYQAVLQDAPPPPPAGAAPGTLASAVHASNQVPQPSSRPADRIISNPDFIFDGTSLDLTMNVVPPNPSQ
jgi:hypothetical protein